MVKEKVWKFLREKADEKEDCYYTGPYIAKMISHHYSAVLHALKILNAEGKIDSFILEPYGDGTWDEIYRTGRPPRLWGINT